MICAQDRIRHNIEHKSSRTTLVAVERHRLRHTGLSSLGRVLRQWPHFLFLLERRFFSPKQERPELPVGLVQGCRGVTLDLAKPSKMGKSCSDPDADLQLSEEVRRLPGALSWVDHTTK